MAFDVSEWCETGRGDSRLLLIAPHGGRRPPVDAAWPPPRLRVNDLYTAEITRELAHTLRASFIINHHMDRNRLDLNRISQVRRQAAWFLHLLAEEVGDILRRHASAEVAFVHGWNTGQPKCDIGVGGVEAAGELRVSDGARLTVAEPYLHTRIATLRAACARWGIVCLLGERYPGSHRNNMLQLFSARGLEIDDPDAHRIGTWAGENRLNAFQLELSIPLRWPGEWRERFVDAMVEAFTGDPQLEHRSQSTEHRLGVREDAGESGRSTPDAPRADLQFYDAAANIGMIAGVGRLGARALSGRLLLFLGGQRVALFTGEEVTMRHHAVRPLALRREDESLRLEFTGPMLLLDDAAAYLDLEAALAASRLIDADVQLRFQPLAAAVAGSAQFGPAVGHIAVDGSAHEIHAGAFANAGAFRASGASGQTMLAAVFSTEHAVLSHASDSPERCVGLQFGAASARHLDGARIAVTTIGDAYTPATFALHCAQQAPLFGEVQSRMGILRPTADGYLRVTFGVARFRWDGQEGHGLYEYARKLVIADE